jgi:hypothetical protein
MVQLIFYALFAAAMAFAGWKVWDGFTGQYVAQGAAAQLEADKPIVLKANNERDAALARADAAEKEAARAVAGASTQSKAIEEANAQAAAAIKAARSQSIAYAQEVARKDGRIKTLQAAAAAVPRTGQSCEAILSATDAILRESSRQRLPVGPK